MPRCLWIFLFLLAVPALAHVGNRDVYFDGEAGPYNVFVTVRPPLVIPGVAELEVRAQGPGVRSIKAVPVPLTGIGAKLAPVPDELKASEQDRQFFTGSLWIMQAGSWQVRLTVNGAQGAAQAAVPVPAVAQNIKGMQPGLAVGLAVLGLLLMVGIILIVGASVAEAKLDPGQEPDTSLNTRARRAMAIAFVIVTALLGLGWYWWRSEEAQYRQELFQPLRMHASVDRRGLLRLQLREPSVSRRPGKAALLHPTFFARSVDDLVPDHDYLMHLYALREPGLDVVYHLHPKMTDAGLFELALPKTEPGRYRLYADIVHANGFPETLVADLDVPAGLPARRFSGDDASAIAAPWQAAPYDATSFRLPDGYTMVWHRGSGTLKAKEPSIFRFELLDPEGRAPRDMQLYLGMTGHAAFVKTDGSAFAHIHPAGTVAMASLEMAEQQLGSSPAESDSMARDMPGMHHDASAIPNQVGFPYGFPSPGRYRIIVQMKHGGTVETGIFDAVVPGS